MPSNLVVSDEARDVSKMSLREVEAVVSAINELSVYTLGDIVEVGTYRGGTTEIIAQNADNQRAIWAVDLFECTQKDKVADLCAGSTIEPHRLYHDRLGQFGNVSIIIGDSGTVGRSWQGKVAFLIIDAGHRYEDAKRDFEAWAPHVVVGGVMVLHDAAPFTGKNLEGNNLSGLPGVIKFSEEVARSGDWKHLQTVDTAVFYRKNPEFSYQYGD